VNLTLRLRGFAPQNNLKIDRHAGRCDRSALRHRGGGERLKGKTHGDSGDHASIVTGDMPRPAPPPLVPYRDVTNEIKRLLDEFGDIKARPDERKKAT